MAPIDKNLHAKISRLLAQAAVVITPEQRTKIEQAMNEPDILLKCRELSTLAPYNSQFELLSPEQKVLVIDDARGSTAQYGQNTLLDLDNPEASMSKETLSKRIKSKLLAIFNAKAASDSGDSGDTGDWWRGETVPEKPGKGLAEDEFDEADRLEQERLLLERETPYGLGEKTPDDAIETEVGERVNRPKPAGDGEELSVEDELALATGKPLSVKKETVPGRRPEQHNMVLDPETGLLVGTKPEGFGTPSVPSLLRPYEDYQEQTAPKKPEADPVIGPMWTGEQLAEVRQIIDSLAPEMVDRKLRSRVQWAGDDWKVMKALVKTKISHVTNQQRRDKKNSEILADVEDQISLYEDVTATNSGLLRDCDRAINKINEDLAKYEAARALVPKEKRQSETADVKEIRKTLKQLLDFKEFASDTELGLGRAKQDFDDLKNKRTELFNALGIKGTDGEPFVEQLDIANENDGEAKIPERLAEDLQNLFSDSDAIIGEFNKTIAEGGPGSLEAVVESRREFKNVKQQIDALMGKAKKANWKAQIQKEYYDWEANKKKKEGPVELTRENIPGKRKTIEALMATPVDQALDFVETREDVFDLLPFYLDVISQEEPFENVDLFEQGKATILEHLRYLAGRLNKKDSEGQEAVADVANQVDQAVYSSEQQPPTGLPGAASAKNRITRIAHGNDPVKIAIASRLEEIAREAAENPQDTDIEVQPVEYIMSHWGMDASEVCDFLNERMEHYRSLGVPEDDSRMEIMRKHESVADEMATGASASAVTYHGLDPKKDEEDASENRRILLEKYKSELSGQDEEDIKNFIFNIPDAEMKQELASHFDVKLDPDWNLIRKKKPYVGEMGVERSDRSTPLNLSPGQGGAPDLSLKKPDEPRAGLVDEIAEFEKKYNDLFDSISDKLPKAIDASLNRFWSDVVLKNIPEAASGEIDEFGDKAIAKIKPLSQRWVREPKFLMGDVLKSVPEIKEFQPVSAKLRGLITEWPGEHPLVGSVYDIGALLESIVTVPAGLQKIFSPGAIKAAISSNIASSEKSPAKGHGETWKSGEPWPESYGNPAEAV